MKEPEPEFVEVEVVSPEEVIADFRANRKAKEETKPDTNSGIIGLVALGLLALLALVENRNRTKK